MIKKILAATGVAFGLALLGVAVSIAPASATETPVCGTWLMRGATGTYPNIEFGSAPEGASVDSASKVTLVKPTEGDLPGVEFAAYDLDVTVEADTEVSVSFEADEADAHSLGAIRIFAYQEQDADTINDGPFRKAEADSYQGTLRFTIPAGTTIGTLGLTYDGSNSVKGKVVFTDLMIGDRLVSFVKCGPTTIPSATATSSPGATPSATKPAGPAKPTGAKATASKAAMLPLTGKGGGTNMPLVIAVVGGVLVLGGGSAVWALTAWERRG